METNYKVGILIAIIIALAIVCAAIIGILPELLEGSKSSSLHSSTPRVIDVSAEELVAWYAQFDNQLHAEEMAKTLYYGKCVQWTGVIEDHMTSRSGNAIVWSYGSGLTQVAVNAWFDADIEDLLYLSKGDVVTVVCEIRGIHVSPFGGGYVSLNNCHLAEAD